MSAPAPASRDETKLGFLSATAAYLFWGGMPVYIHSVGFADPFEILAARILWSLPAAMLAVGLMSGWRNGLKEIAAAFRPKMLATLSASAVFIFGNWGIYVWAVAHSHVMEAALAYFISPLATVLIGVIAFGERLRTAQIISIVLAGAGVVVQGIALGAPPWISLLLCASWVSYSVVRKQAQVPAAVGLLVETIVLTPVAIGILVWVASQHPLAFGQALGPSALLAFSGIVTALPLILFSFGARRLPLSTLGLLNYMTPSLQFLVGVAYGEPLTPLRVVSFALIWAALVVFTAHSLAVERARRRAVQPAP